MPQTAGPPSPRAQKRTEHGAAQAWLRLHPRQSTFPAKRGAVACAVGKLGDFPVGFLLINVSAAVAKLGDLKWPSFALSTAVWDCVVGVTDFPPAELGRGAPSRNRVLVRGRHSAWDGPGLWRDSRAFKPNPPSNPPPKKNTSNDSLGGNTMQTVPPDRPNLGSAPWAGPKQTLQCKAAAVQQLPYYRRVPCANCHQPVITGPLIVGLFQP